MGLVIKKKINPQQDLQRKRKSFSRWNKLFSINF